jgi:hypothetical protein
VLPADLPDVCNIRLWVALITLLHPVLALGVDNTAEH